MKRLILSKYLLFFAFFHLFNIFCISEYIPEKILSPSSLPPQLSSLFYHLQEGFCGTTIVRTPYGYIQIKDFVKGDVVIDCNGKEKKIIAILRHYVDRYIKLVINDESIYTGYDQRYYTFSTNALVAAQDIKAGDILLNSANEPCFVTCAELIHKNTILYCLAVKDHTFSIEPGGLCVHNAEPFILGASGLCLSNVIVINPIIATIGATIALSVIAHKAYQVYAQRYPDEEHNIGLSVDVILAERSYYIQRSTTLQEIKQEFLRIKNDLEKIEVLCNLGSNNFTYQFLKQINVQDTYTPNQLLKISVEREIKLSDKEKEYLRTLREIDLQHLEQEITKLQTILALHLDELIKQADVANDEYKKTLTQISYSAGLENNNFRKIPNSEALQMYKAVLLEDHLLNDFKQKCNELKVVTEYYKNSVNNMCLKQSTNIIDLVEKLVFVIPEYEQWIINRQDSVYKKSNVIEQYLARWGISIGQIKNETRNHLQKDKNKRNTQAIVEAKNKLASMALSGGPNKDPEKDPQKRKVNKMSKSEFLKKVNNDYEHYRDNIYRRKPGVKGIEDAEYIQWDNLHNDVEAYAKNRFHMGSIDPHTLKMYKGPKHAKLKI